METELVELDQQALLDSPDEYEHMRLAVETLNGLHQVGLTLITDDADLRGRNDAVELGLAVRIVKLCEELLRDACAGDSRMQAAIMRMLTETTAVLLYLVADRSGARHDAYVLNSLVAERESLKTISDERRRSGRHEPSPIEVRLEASIARVAAAAGVDPNAIPGRDKIGWPKIERLIESAYGDTAYMSYRIGSDSIHGNWHDLEWNHLAQRADGRFVAYMRPIMARPQTLNGATIRAALALAGYLQHRPGAVGDSFGPALAMRGQRAVTLEALHEQWLVRHPDRH